MTTGAAAVIVIVLVVSLMAATGASAQEDRVPAFTHQGLVLGDDLVFDPTGEWVFPTVLRAAEHFDAPMAEYYLYTAPHDSPGGISLFYADDLAGPWVEYAANPVIRNSWAPHYHVSHVSSPHAVWLSEEETLFLYFHGENDTTRYAMSDDGIHFTYGGIAVTASASGPNVSEASYARVYELEIQGRGNRYTMTFMDAIPGDGLGNRIRRIRLAVSTDARTWVVDPEPLVTPHPSEGTSISGATWFPWNGTNYVAYHGSSGNIFLTDVGERFDQERHVGLLHRSLSAPPDNGRAAAPTFIVDGQTMHMFYEAGPRSGTAIAHATADLSGSGVVPEALPPLPPPEPEFPEPRVPTYTDVDPTSSHFDDIHILAANGLTNGCGRGTTYCPDRAVTRAEMATFIMRAAGLPSNAMSTRFTDVAPSSSHVPGIAAIDAAGLTNGCGRGATYCPDRAVTRAEMATFLMRTLQLPPRTGSRYVDVVAGSTHAPGIEAIAHAGLTNGCGRQKYCPDRDVTRAEMASFLVRAFSLE